MSRTHKLIHTVRRNDVCATVTGMLLQLPPLLLLNPPSVLRSGREARQEHNNSTRPHDTITPSQGNDEGPQPSRPIDHLASEVPQPASRTTNRVESHRSARTPPGPTHPPTTHKHLHGQGFHSKVVPGLDDEVRESPALEVPEGALVLHHALQRRARRPKNLATKNKREGERGTEREKEGRSLS